MLVDWSPPQQMVFPQEPIFVATPGSTAEDDGVLLTSGIILNGQSRSGLFDLFDKFTPYFD